MGKPFVKELKKIKDTILWADKCDISNLRSFLYSHIELPLVCIGSGGSTSACHLASMLHREYCGISMPMTPLEFQELPVATIESTRCIFISASGNNKDIIQSYKRGVIYNFNHVASLCTSLENKISEIAEGNSLHKQFHYDLPSGKDGFLATNSLIAFFALLIKAFENCSISSYIDLGVIESQPYTTQNIENLSLIENFVVIYGKYGESIAVDVESKLSEAGLAATLLSDFRNFGHGRHNWFDKRRNNSCLVVIYTLEDKDLANKTLENLPHDLPLIKIFSKYSNSISCLDLLIRSFYFVSDLGKSRGIDPGKPGVPEYGKLLYHLSYQKLLKQSKKELPLKHVAILRKAHVRMFDILSENEQLYYNSCLAGFISKINTEKFGMIAFDYDGTLSGSDYKSRYNTELAPSIKEYIIKFLEHGIYVAIITGRGQSMYQLLNKEIPNDLKHLLYLGHYNGLDIYPLSTPHDLSQYKTNNLELGLNVLVEKLRETCPFLEKVKIEERQYQLTISCGEYSHFISERCKEIIVEEKLKDIHVWESSHSMDIVISGIVDKRNIKKHINCPALFIGDSGSLEGNDFQMLSESYSLSVDKVSYNPLSCWNLAPQGCKGAKATLYYLSKIKMFNGFFQIKL